MSMTFKSVNQFTVKDKCLKNSQFKWV